MTRRQPTPRERREIYARQDGLCACGCGRPLGTRWVADHMHALELGGGNEMENFQGLCIKCDKDKTGDDKGKIAKVKRITGKTGSQWHGTNLYKGRLRSRGFPKARDE